MFLIHIHSSALTRKEKLKNSSIIKKSIEDETT